MGKKSEYGSGMNNPDHISESLETIFWVKILKFFDADPGSGMEKIRIRDNIPDPPHGNNYLLKIKFLDGRQAALVTWWWQLCDPGTSKS
jgi:hypothetical protein